MAMSAFRSSTLRSWPWSGKREIPMLTSVCRAIPSRVNGSARTWRSRTAIAAALEQDRELVPAQPRQQVAGVQLLGEPHADLDQQPVPDVMPEAVVDLLEPVQVEQEERTPALPGQQTLRDVLVQGPPVGQPGQFVGPRLVVHVRHPHQLLECQLG